jgi:hypothetical protein
MERVEGRQHAINGCRALVLFLGLFSLFLAVLSAESATEELNASHEAISDGLDWNKASEAQSFDDAWNWLEGVVFDIGHPSYPLVKEVCQEGTGDKINGTCNDPLGLLFNRKNSRLRKFYELRKMGVLLGRGAVDNLGRYTENMIPNQRDPTIDTKMIQTCDTTWPGGLSWTGYTDWPTSTWGTGGSISNFFWSGQEFGSGQHDDNHTAELDDDHAAELDDDFWAWDDDGFGTWDDDDGGTPSWGEACGQCVVGDGIGTGETNTLGWKGTRFVLNESNAFVQYEQQRGERGSLIYLNQATAFDSSSSAAYVSDDDGDTVAERCILHPCFILTNATDDVKQGIYGEVDGFLVVKHPAFAANEWGNARNKCRGVFVTNGPNVLPYCRRMAQLGGPAELASYVAGLLERPGGPNDAGYLSQCKTLNSLQTQEELHSTFVDIFNHSAGMSSSPSLLLITPTIL